jgi:hypothetical protein
MERKASGPHDQVSQKGNEKDAIMAMFCTIVHALDGEVDEQQVRESVDDLGGIVGYHIVLEKDNDTVRSLSWSFSYHQGQYTSSHQSSVDVIGAQYPSCLSGGYGIERSQDAIVYRRVKLKSKMNLLCSVYHVWPRFRSKTSGKTECLRRASDLLPPKSGG